jgi:UDP-N-acetylglucosamine 1-carboxyvinyltransferase
MAEIFEIKGQNKLKGEIEVSGSKNATTPILAATLLTEKSCIIKNLPLVEDIFRMIEILKDLGAKIDWLGEREIKVQAKNINPYALDKNLVGKLRSSILFVGPLLSRFKETSLFQPGGCLIGNRPIDAHLEGFSELGAEIKEVENKFNFKLKKTKAAEIVLPEFSVTATENILLAASLIPQKTIIKIAALEPHVMDLIAVLKKMGVEINVKEPHQIEIKGKKKLNGFDHQIIYDPTEAGTYLILAGITKSKFKVKNAKAYHLDLVLKKLKDFGMNFEIEKDGIIADGQKKLKAVQKIQTMPYPGIPTDLQCNFGVLATQADGVTLIHDPLFEGRLKYLEELNQMGARVIFCDPHRALVFGPTKLYGKNIKTYDLRGGAALILAALTASGKSTIDNVYQIDRGYEKIEEKFKKLGAKIERKTGV